MKSWGTHGRFPETPGCPWTKGGRSPSLATPHPPSRRTARGRHFSWFIKPKQTKNPSRARPRGHAKPHVSLNELFGAVYREAY